ncbi:DUF1643 domain-containing protein [Exiguobacterium sp. SH0S1]|nr:DUF1643 domain-containing protein [Exiguobacterium sp. SH0S1]
MEAKHMFKPWDSQYRVKAVLDETGKYRYQFTCEWGEGGRFVTFVMLNPSQGNQGQDDRTLQRCISFAKSWGYDGIKVVNLFAFISTDPDNLKHQEDPIGPENDRHIRDAIQGSALVVAAWGQTLRTPSAKRRIQATLELLKDIEMHCLKVTKCGRYPMHPLYLSSKLTPIPFVPPNHRNVIKVPQRTVPQATGSREAMFSNGSDIGFFDDPDWEV